MSILKLGNACLSPDNLGQIARTFRLDSISLKAELLSAASAPAMPEPTGFQIPRFVPQRMHTT